MGQCCGINSKPLPAKVIFKPICEICSETLDLSQRCPMMICVNQHSCCRECYDRIKSNNKCPYCKQKLLEKVSKNRLLADQVAEYITQFEKPNIVSQTQTANSEQIKLFRQELTTKTIEKARELNYQKVTYAISVAFKTPLTKVLDIVQEQSEFKGILDLSIFQSLQRLIIRKQPKRFYCTKYPMGCQRFNISEWCKEFPHNNKKGFGFLPNLKLLEVAYKHLHQIPQLGVLPSLETLKLEITGISKIINLDSYKSLKELSLMGNCIDKIENMEILVCLQSLNLSQNQIQKLQNLQTLQNLKKLDVSSNLIVKIKNLDMIIKLNQLFLSYNRIEKIENLQNLVNLTALRLNGNRIRIVQNLYMLSNLKTLLIDAKFIDRKASHGELLGLKEGQGIVI